jgi:hypothetical protein
MVPEPLRAELPHSAIRSQEPGVDFVFWKSGHVPEAPMGADWAVAFRQRQSSCPLPNDRCLTFCGSQGPETTEYLINGS